MNAVFRFCLTFVVLGLLSSILVPVNAQRSLSEASPTSSQGTSSQSNPEIPFDGYWDFPFNLPSASGPVYAIHLITGKFCIGGDFDSVGGVAANNVACLDWSTKTWSPLGAGVDGPVRSLTCVRGDLYAGGEFSKAGDVNALRIARWDTGLNTWQNIGGVTGIGDAVVNVLENDRNDIGCGDKYLYAGGEFYYAGGVSADNVARFDASTDTWSALNKGLANGVAGPVQALTVQNFSDTNQDVYVGGWFQGIGGVSSVNAYNIAKWNSASRDWTEVTNTINGTGSVNGPVDALEICSPYLYVGGFFTEAGLAPARNFAKVYLGNVRTWSPVGQGTDRSVEEIACISDYAVYIGGVFTQAGNIAANHIARWNVKTSTFSALGSGTSGPVYSLLPVNATVLYDMSWRVYVGGSFSGAGQTGSANLALYKGDYNSLDPGDKNWDINTCSDNVPNASVNAITSQGNILYYGGDFTAIGSISASHVAQYDSKRKIWSALGDGVNGVVRAIAVKGNDVYIAGEFTSAGGHPATNVARWNSASHAWEVFSGGPDGVVKAIAVSDTGVFVGGSFATAGEATVNNIARWDFGAKTWSALGQGSVIGMDGVVNALAVSGNDLYAGGAFTHAQDVSASNIARWDGATWSGLTSGVAGGLDVVYAAGIHNNADYVVGNYEQAGGLAAKSIAYWDGAAWHAMPGLGGSIRAIAFNMNDVYVAGSFMVGPVAIARWNGSAWYRLGSGIYPYFMSDEYGGLTPRALAVGADGIYVGGGFVNLYSMLLCKNKALWKTATTSPGTGSVGGVVRSPGGVPIAGGPIQICYSDGSGCPWFGTAEANGNYLASGLTDGEYIVTVYPPAGSSDLPVASGRLVISGGSALTQDLQLVAIAPLPAGVSLTPSGINSTGVPRVNWKQALRLTAAGCAGGSATYQVRQAGATVASGALAENTARIYSASLPALAPVVGYVQVSLSITCPTLIPTIITFDVYVNPTGTLRTINDQPVVGATVTLFAYDPETMALSPVPTSSPLLSPASQVNPDLTDTSGAFGWDVAAGTYLIRAEKEGCVSAAPPYWDFAQTGLLATPAEMVDLDLRMTCAGGISTIYLPVVHR